MKYQIHVLVDGIPRFVVGTWTDPRQAAYWLDRFDEWFGDLECDLADEYERIEDGFNVVEVETVIVEAIVADDSVVNDKGLWEEQSREELPLWEEVLLDELKSQEEGVQP